MTNSRYLFLLPVIAVLLIYIGKFASTSPAMLFWVIVAVVIGVVTFLKPENGLMVVVFSMLLSPELNVASLPGREVAIRVDDLLIIVIFVAWLAHTAVDKDWQGFSKTPLDVPLIVLFSIYAISTTMGIVSGSLNPVKSLFYLLKYFEYFLLYWITSNIITSRKDIRKFLIAGAITCAAVAIYGYSLFNKVDRIYAPFDTIGPGIAGGESASLGGYLLIIMSLLLALIAFSERFNWWALAGIIFLAPPFIRTLSRASYYAFGAALAVFLLFTPRRKATFAVLIVLGALILPLTGKFYYESMVSRMHETFTGPATFTAGSSKVNLELSAAARVYSWQRAFTVWLPEKPLLGHGLTGVGLVDAQYPLFLGEIGIIGFIAFLYVIVKIYIYSFRTVKNGRTVTDKTLALGLIAAMSGLLVQAVAVNTFIVVRIMEPFWFLTALVVGVQDHEEEGAAA